MLQKIKNLLGITDASKDTQLQIMIDSAIEEAIAYTHNPKCIPCIESAIVDMVLYKYNRLGTAGLSGESYNSTSYSYTSEYPASILNVLNAHRKVRTIC